MIKKLISLIAALAIMLVTVLPTGALELDDGNNIVIDSTTAESLGVGDVQEDGSVVISEDDFNSLANSDPDQEALKAELEETMPEVLQSQRPGQVQQELKPECDRNCGVSNENVNAHADHCQVKAFWRSVWDRNDAAALALMWEQTPAGAQDFLLNNYSWQDQAKRAELVKLLEEMEQEDPEDPTEPEDPEDSDPDSDLGPLYELEQTVGDTTIQASGYNMEGVSMSVTEVPEAEWDDNVYKYTAGEEIEFALDITMTDRNGEWQPTGDSVQIVLDAADYGWVDGQIIGIAHEHDGTVRYLGSDVVADGKLEFDAEGFSTFYGFTVDFHYEGIMFSIEGMSSIYLHELFKEMNIDLDATQAVDVTFSDPSLLAVSRDDTGWLLTSLVAFLTEESLTVTFADGSQFVMRVTDASPQECDTAVELGNSDYTSSINGGTLTKNRTWKAVKNSSESYINDPVKIPSGIWLKIVDNGKKGTKIYRKAANLKQLFVVEEGGLLIINGSKNDAGTILDITLDGRAAWQAVWDTSVTGDTAISDSIRNNKYAGKNMENRNSVVKNTGYAAEQPLIECAGSLWMQYVTLQNNDVTTRDGGGISLKKGGSGDVIMSKCMFKNLRSPMGSAIFISEWQAVEGAIKAVNANYDGGSTDKVGVHIKDSVFHRNMTYESIDPDDGDLSYGGTIRTGGSTGTNMLIQDCDLYLNWTHWNGGGIYWNAAGQTGCTAITNTKCTVKDCRFSENQAGNSGGGLYIQTQFSLEFTDSAWSPGYGPTGDNTYDGIIIRKNVAGVMESGSYGGGICVATYSKVDMPGFSGEGYNVALKDRVSIYQNEVKNNGYGGGIGIHCRDSSVASASAMTFTITGEAKVYSNTAKYGGGIAFVDTATSITGKRTFNVTGGSIYSNTATTEGGGIYIRRSSATRGTMNTITLSGGSIYSNTASAGGGGGIYIETLSTDCPVLLSGTNIGKSGGGNTASGGGGGIYALSGGTNGQLTFNATGGSSSYNTSDGSGGGIRLHTSGTGSDLTATFSGGTFNNNTAKWGGGINVKPTASGDATCVVTISGATVNSNKATGDAGSVGGGVYIDSTTASTAANACKVTISSGNVKGNNVTGNGGGICVRKSGTGAVNVTISGGTVSGNHAVYGGGLYLYSNAAGNMTVGISNGTVGGTALATAVGTGSIGNYADTEGGGIYIENCGTGTLTTNISGGQVKFNKAPSGGGLAMRASNGSLITKVTGGSVFSNKATDGGGGGYFCVSHELGNLDLTLDGGSIYSNTTSSNGGGIYLWSDADYVLNLYMNSGSTAKIYSNTASNMGGAIYCRSAGDTTPAGNANPYMALTAGEIYSNSAKNGGGIATYCTDDSYMSFQINGTNIYKNTASAYGGGVYCYLTPKTTNDSGTVTDTGSGRLLAKFDGGLIGSTTLANGNTATSGGGGVFVQNKGSDSVTLNLNGTDVNYNTAGTNGGGYAIVKDGTGSVAVNITNASDIIGNVATANNGGGIYMRNGTTGAMSLSIAKGSINKNTAGQRGGGICLLNNSTGSLNVTLSGGCSINENTASGTQTDLSGGGGIGMYNGSNGTMSLSMTGGSINSNTTIATGGGGLHMRNDGATGSMTATISGGSIDGNTVAATSNGGGGGVLTGARGGTVTVNMSNGTVNNNEAPGSGGGFRMYSNGTGKTVLNLTGGTVNGNKATYGGGVNLKPTGSSTAECTINGVTIDGNSSTGVAGGVYVDVIDSAVANVTMKNGTISNNVSGSSAGGLYAYLSNSSGKPSITLNITGGTIRNNTSSNNGGGVSLRNDTAGTLTASFDGGAIYQNVAAEKGGGIYVHQSSTGTDTLVIGGGAIHENTADNGGGIYIIGAKASVTLNGGYLVGNKALGTPASLTTALDPDAEGTVGVGGGVYVHSGSFAMMATGVTNLHSNLADFAADDVYSSADGKVTLPAVGTMALTYPETYVGEKTPMNVTDWFEDYVTADTKYTSGLAGGGFPNGSAAIMRYKDTTAVTNDSRVVNTQLTISGKYVALTLGYEYFDLTISKTGTDTALDPDQTYVFRIKGAEGATAMIDLTVVIHGDETVTIKALPPGDYDIIEESGWSWRYELSNVTGGAAVDDQASGTTSVWVDQDMSLTYTNTREEFYWIDGSSYRKNKFTS